MTVDPALVEAVPGTAAGQAFVDLVCADDELMRAEFDALIAASWPSPPAVPPVPPRRPAPWPGGPALPPGEAARPPIHHIPDTSWRRQRAPP
ncbi:hypothetical protein ODJ79_25455 [Actinoplanes sp. KI2]|uniref:hypothetical protein n=1 Tax=Actinoplanes sp. KI2 TaxID=2983315 RepID=UPI0021D5F325|nr:hypothetical protein [Actinoplanes sp. KI2]MCU7727088.1 hypothetical protein [Actinoplanes sp. KI2]